MFLNAKYHCFLFSLPGSQTVTSPRRVQSFKRRFAKISQSRTFSLLKAPTSTLYVRHYWHYAKQAHKQNRWVALRIYANQTACPLWPLHRCLNFMSTQRLHNNSRLNNFGGCYPEYFVFEFGIYFCCGRCLWLAEVAHFYDSTRTAREVQKVYV